MPEGIGSAPAGSVVVTGAGQGLGRAVARAFALRGAAVVLSDINPDSVEQVAKELATLGSTVVAVAGDAGDESAVAALAERAEGEVGPIGVWVNNAGISRPAMLQNMTVEDFDVVLRVHVRGTFLGMREAARRMLASGTRGVILNVTSSAGLQGTIGQVNYSAAKGAITALTKSGARELARYGIRVNAVAPLAATPMTQTLRRDPKLRDRYLAQIPLGRFGEPDEAATVFAFLAAPESAYITGQVVCVDGGLYMAS